MQLVRLYTRGFLLLCKVTDFAFGIGGSDTITLLNAKKQTVDSVKLASDGSNSKTTKRVPDGSGNLE
jgi:hypothetical protein